MLYSASNGAWSAKIGSLTLALLGEGGGGQRGKFCPLSDFLGSSKQAAGVDAKISAPSLASIQFLPSKFQKKLSREF